MHSLHKRLLKLYVYVAAEYVLSQRWGYVISFTVCLFIRMSVRKFFCNGYLRRGFS